MRFPPLFSAPRLGTDAPFVYQDYTEGLQDWDSLYTIKWLLRADHRSGKGLSSG